MLSFIITFTFVFLFLYLSLLVFLRYNRGMIRGEVKENLSLCRYGTCEEESSYKKARLNFTTGFKEFNDESKPDKKLISYISNPPYY